MKTKKDLNQKGGIEKILFFVFLLVFILTLGKVIMANILATTGNQLSRLEGEAISLKAENQTLEEELVKLTTLSRISQEAQKLGLKKASFIVFLRQEIPVALR